MSRLVLLASFVVAVGCQKSSTRDAPPVSSPGGTPEPREETILSSVAPQPAPTKTKPDVIFVPTPQERVDAMLELADPREGEKLYDLGCGDGRIPITAAKRYGVRGVCIDIDPARIREARANVIAAGVEDLVEVRQEDLFETDFSDADIVTLYLLPRLNLELRPRLQKELRPGARVVSHSFHMGDWEPDARREVSGNTVYLWVIRD